MTISSFSAFRKFTSIKDPNLLMSYKMEVLRNPQLKTRPMFRVTTEDGEQERDGDFEQVFYIAFALLPCYYMDSSLNVNVSFRQLLHNICVQFSLPPPRYRMTVLTDGRLCSHVDVEVPRSSRFMEIITCHGAPFSEANQTQEDAACVAIKRLSNKLALKLEMLIWRTRNIIKTYMIVLVKSIWNFKMSMK
ncbi:uncharacterized protein LOC109725257 [Ananas comosus]|uniref:Uncharacterized protein LOC109725257 n=1 Tax=Ananas comosus TaxID=4615 RepID=A0A6P5GVV9_ANACO|nr:uncharacterized protein LOC109725257 [Ananas comosus]